MKIFNNPKLKLIATYKAIMLDKDFEGEISNPMSCPGNKSFKRVNRLKNVLSVRWAFRTGSFTTASKVDINHCRVKAFNRFGFPKNMTKSKPGDQVTFKVYKEL